MNLRFHASKVPLAMKLSKLPLGSITAEGWLKEQLRRSAAGSGGHMDELEPDMIRDPFVVQLTQAELDRRREEQRQGRDLGRVRAGWYAEISGTYWTGLVQLAYTLNDRALIAKAERWVNGVLAHQEQSGYIGSYLPTDDRREDYNAWGTNWGLRALFSYYEATGRADVLEACHRGLVWFVDNWKDHRTWYAGPTLMEGMLVGYAHTGDKRLLEWAERYMEWLEKNSPWPNYVSILASPRFDYNSMHTVAYGEELKYPALLSIFDGRQDYLKASINGLAKILDRGTQRTGAPSSNCEYLSPPGASYETEYCNFATFANSFAWMAMITGEARFGDLLEKIVFNGAEGARKKDERAIAYMTSPNQFFATEKSGIYNPSDMEAYAPVYNVACCPAQSVRVMPEFVRAMCMTDVKDELYLMAYGPCDIREGSLRIEQRTEYPFGGDIRLTVHAQSGAERALNLRTPGWCHTPRISVNGKAVQAAPAGGFTAVRRAWGGSDSVEISFEMEPRVVSVKCYDTPTAPLLAVERGPLLFSLPLGEVWKETMGSPLTPLPQGWSWYNVTPRIEDEHAEMSTRYDQWKWNYAVDPGLPRDSRITAVQKPGGGYPWENPPVVVRIPARKARYAFPVYPNKTMPTYVNPVPAGTEETMLELVPYGCTALRVSYFVTAAPESG